MQNIFSQIDFWQVISAFVFLIAIIDPLGNVPITVNMQKNGTVIKPWLVSTISAGILITFLLLGDFMLQVFGLKIEYFAIAGGFITFLMALEMILDIVIFKSDVEGSGNLVPLAFPMYAGPGAFTALISMTGTYSVINLVLAVLVSIAILWVVLTCTNWIIKYLGKNVLYILRKFFGIIVLAIACQLMFGNMAAVFG